MGPLEKALTKIKLEDIEKDWHHKCSEEENRLIRNNPKYIYKTKKEQQDEKKRN